jgi:hypothetical protein
MKTMFKRTFFSALPLVGLLWGVTPTFAHDDDWQHERLHDQLGDVHERAHDQLSDLHEEFHEQPYSRREHRRLHRWLEREHQGVHNDLSDQHQDYHDRDWRWDRRYDGRWDRDNWNAGRQHHGNGWYSGNRWSWW